MSTLTSLGIGSGLDVDSIVTALVNAEKGPLNNVTAQISSYQSKISAYGTLKSALSTFQTAVDALSTTSKFNVQSATSADTGIFTATANGKATVGDYAVKVSQIAKSQKIVSGGFATTGTTLGTGTINISFGEYDSTTNTFTANTSKTGASISIDPSNNTLAGIRDAINAANAGVTATIVNDGSAAGNRLVITSKDTGTVNSVKITVSDSDGNNLDGAGLSQLAYDPTAAAGAGKNLEEKQAATNALLNIDGIDVVKSSNTITDAIQGVTLNLLREGGDTATNLNVATDTDTITKNVQAFVDAYNKLDSTIRNLTNFNAADTTKSGVLLGDSTTRSISTQIKNVLTQTVGSGSITSLSQIGVSFQRDGTLGLDSSKLKTALDSNFSDIANLFSATGSTTDALTSFSGNTAKTKAGTYDVTVTQMATAGTMVGSGGPNLTITAGVNDQVAFNIDGVTYNVTLNAGTYASAQALASELQTRVINAGSLAKVEVDGNGALKMTSVIFGADSSVTITGGNGGSGLFGTPTSTSGVNVAGTINGEPAIGIGQTLKGAAGNDAEGLMVKILGGSTGARGSVTYSTGYATMLDQLADSLLSDNGLLATKTDGINSSIDRLNKQEDALNDRLAAIEARYRAQFTALDTLMSSMQSTSNYLSQQLAALAANE